MEYLKDLNDKQREAVLSLDGPLLILAGAGTGKTKVLTTRMAYILDQNLARHYQILAVTFTNKAAKEMKSRLFNLMELNNNEYNQNDMWLGTFHSIAAKILRRNSELVGLSSSFNIIDDTDQLRLIKGLLENHNIDDDKNISKFVANNIRTWKEMNIPAEHISHISLDNPNQELSAEIYGIYQRKLKEINAVDFGDLLLYNLEIFENNIDILKSLQNKFKYIQVDEYQDTNKTQYLWLRMLVGDTNNICCVGDDDQSIYGWRGADITHILNFPKHFSNTKIIKLEQNYRSTKNILSAASHLISFNKSRHGKILWTNKNDENKVQLTEFLTDKEEAWNIARAIHNKLPGNEENIAILVRSSAQTRLFEEAFLYYGIAYKLLGGLRFYERQEIKDALAYIRLSYNFKDDLSFERIINTPRRGIGAQTIKQIKDFALNTSSSIYEAITQMIALNLFKGKVMLALNELTAKLQIWNKMFETHNLSMVVEEIIEESGYMDMWRNEKTEEAKSKLENLRELIKAVSEFNNIVEFLENVTLASAIDTEYSEIRVLIMTLHAAKGLEFNEVYLPGWEEGLFPHQRSIDENGEMGVEEERRLAYVGLTRAKYKAYISYAFNRNLYGRTGFMSRRSRFIDELPEDSIHKIKAGYENYQPPKNYNLNESEEVNWWPPKGNYESDTQVIDRTSIMKSKLQKGSKVFHDMFGDGIIINKKDEEFEVFFYKSGRKLMKEKFLKIK